MYNPKIFEDLRSWFYSMNLDKIYQIWKFSALNLSSSHPAYEFKLVEVPYLENSSFAFVFNEVDANWEKFFKIVKKSVYEQLKQEFLKMDVSKIQTHYSWNFDKRDFERDLTQIIKDNSELFECSHFQEGEDLLIQVKTNAIFPIKKIRIPKEDMTELNKKGYLLITTMEENYVQNLFKILKTIIKKMKEDQNDWKWSEEDLKKLRD